MGTVAARVGSQAKIRAARATEERSRSLPLADAVITGMASLAAIYLLVMGRWAPGAVRSAFAFAVVAAGPPILRALSARFPQSRAADLAATVWLLPSVLLGHANLQPIIDAANPRLLDHALAMSDVRIFGTLPSMGLSAHVHGVFTDVLLLCYYLYFVWPPALAMVLYFRRSREMLDTYLLALTLCFAINFVGYVVVPAIGPRYYAANLFAQPLHGAVLTPWLESLMRQPVFARDCFPSGHTAGTLVVLVFAFRSCRRFFWLMLPFGLGLITATVAGRFHYGTDLICAVPLVALVTMLAAALGPARAPRAERSRTGPAREPMRA